MIPVVWDIIGSYATLAEQPIWALATKDFDKDYQFNQKWLELLPELVKRAAAEGSIIYMDTATQFNSLSYDAAQQARLAAAAGGHMNALEWLEERQPTRYVYLDGYKNYEEYLDEVVECNLTDAMRVWTVGAMHAEVREWAEKLARKHYMILTSLPKTPEGEEYTKHIFVRSATYVAALNGDIAALDQLRKDMGDRFNNWLAMVTALLAGCKPAIEWCLPELREPEGHPGLAITCAAEYKNLEVMQILIKRGFQVMPDICDYAFDLKILQFLVGMGCVLSKNTYANTAGEGEVETLEWLQEQKCPQDLEDALSVAVKKSNYPVVQYLLNKGAIGSRMLTEASRKGHIEIIRLCVAHGIKWNGAEMIGAARYNRLDVLKLLKDLGAPMHPNACNEALEYCNYEAYLWLRKEGCPKDDQTEEKLRFVPAFVREENNEC